MPFKSQSQRRFMYSQHPGIAKRWEKETPSGKLPDKRKESADMPNMGNVFEAKGKKKKKDFGGPGKETEVDCVPDPVFWNDLELEEGLRMFEDLDIKKLHNTDDFTKELQQFVGQMHTEVRALQAFIDSKKTDPKLHQGMRSFMLKLAAIVRGIDDDAGDLNDQVDQLISYMSSVAGQEQEAKPTTSQPTQKSEKLFKK